MVGNECVLPQTVFYDCLESANKALFTFGSEVGGQGQEQTKIWKAKTKCKIKTTNEHTGRPCQILFPGGTQGFSLLRV